MFTTLTNTRENAKCFTLVSMTCSEANLRIVFNQSITYLYQTNGPPQRSKKK